MTYPVHGFEDDEELIRYCEIHCETERALFSREQVNRMMELAGVTDKWLGYPIEQAFISLHSDMNELCKLAREKLEGAVENGGA